MVPVETVAIIPRVFGPTAPYPVVAKVPEETIPFDLWKDLTAASVSAPKNPVALPGARRFWEMRNRCNAATSAPERPRKRVRAGRLAEGAAADGCEEDGAEGFVTAVEEVGVHESPIAARVLGPSMPVLSIPCSPCHCFTAACVMGPKRPVGDGKSVYALWRNVWSAVTDEPVEPMARVGQVAPRASSG